MQQVRFINNQFILNMFRAYLRPSSEGRIAFYCLWFPVIVVMMLESRVVRCVHCDEDVALHHNNYNRTRNHSGTFGSIKSGLAYLLSSTGNGRLEVSNTHYLNEGTTNWMQQVRFINNRLILNMFRAYLRPSSGGRTAFYCDAAKYEHCDEDAALQHPRHSARISLPDSPAP
jgi:hypothetical protein